MAQVALAIFTIVTIYTTVIPLYQKSLLDEAIAKKEIELKEATIALDHAYERIRYSATRDYVWAAGPFCSGLLEPIDEESSSSVRSGQRIPTVYQIDSTTCLLQSMPKVALLKELRPSDRQRLEQEIRRIGTELHQIKQVSLKSYQDVAFQGANPDTKLGKFSERFLQHYSKRMSQDEVVSVERTMKRNAALLTIETEYKKAIRERVMRLYKIKWNAQPKK